MCVCVKPLSQQIRRIIEPDEKRKHTCAPLPDSHVVQGRFGVCQRDLGPINSPTWTPGPNSAFLPPSHDMGHSVLQQGSFISINRKGKC